MKRIVLLVAVSIASAMVGKATIITVDNNLNSAALYTDIQTAVDAATSGDTIHIIGSSIAYTGAVTIKKTLHVIGAGYKPKKNQNSTPSTCPGITITRDLISDASGTTIEGIFCNGGIQVVGYDASNYISNVTIKRNEATTIYVSAYTDQIFVYNNIMNDLQSATANNSGQFYVQNNIFRAGASFGGNLSVQTGSTIVKNNLFFSPGAGTITAVANMTFENNMFLGVSANALNHDNCSFVKNLTFGASDNTYNITGSNSGSGNLEGVDPQLAVNLTLGTFADTDDYTVIGGAAQNGGTDGTDIGIYGGSYPFPIGGASGTGFQMAQEPALPQIYELNIQNPTVAPGSSLNVEVKARKQD